jgi:hypothetical protein
MAPCNIGRFLGSAEKKRADGIFVEALSFLDTAAFQQSRNVPAGTK